ncbi:MAG: FHA domain-containing protein [Gammaproteobacteria bacterium]|nr:FHA domain-containing protein [Gammaproteobacteria bacterium]
MALLRRKFTPFMALHVDQAQADPLGIGSLVERVKADLSALTNPIARTASRLRALFPGRPRKPLVLDLPGKTLVFSSPAEFEFGLASRVEFPVRKAARLVELDVAELEGMAAKLRAVERRFAAVFARCLRRPHLIGALMGELGAGLFSRDHDWRDIVGALNRHDESYDDYKHVALVKYMQYLGSRQAVLRSIYVDKTHGDYPEHLDFDPVGSADHDCREALQALDEARETAELPAWPGAQPRFVEREGADERASGLKEMPRGETLCVRFVEGRELELRLARHRYRLFPGKHFCLVDERTGVTHLLRAGRNVIGRHSGNEVVVDQSYLTISRKHLIVEPVSDNAALITDISSHGTSITPQYV